MTGAQREEFRAEFAAQLRVHIKQRFSSDAAAAKDLGISRQRLQKYMERAMTPGADFVFSVMSRWKIPVRFGGTKFTASGFRPRPRTRPEVDRQLEFDLIDMPQILKNKTIQLKAVRRSDSILRVMLDIKLAG
jgi:hypothetical protein